MLDWLTMGLVSGFAQGLGDRWEEMVQSPSLYHTANWLSLGFAGEVRGAVAPEEALSLEHWLHSLGVVSALYSAYAMGKRAAREYRQAAELEKMTKYLPTGGLRKGRTFKSSYEIPVDEEGFTKSSTMLGQKVHNEYKTDAIDGIKRMKEYRLPSGKRVIYINIKTKTIYELKPHNSRQIQVGIKQLQAYLNKMEDVYGEGRNVILDTY